MSCELTKPAWFAELHPLGSTMSLQFAPPSASRVGGLHRGRRSWYFRTGVTAVLAMFQQFLGQAQVGVRSTAADIVVDNGLPMTRGFAQFDIAWNHRLVDSGAK